LVRCDGDVRRSQWRIYVDCRDYQNWLVRGRRNALDERRLCAEPTAAFTADAVDNRDDVHNSTDNQLDVRFTCDVYGLCSAG